MTRIRGFAIILIFLITPFPSSPFPSPPSLLYLLYVLSRYSDVSAAKPAMDIGETLEQDRIPVAFKGTVMVWPDPTPSLMIQIRFMQ